MARSIMHLVCCVLSHSILISFGSLAAKAVPLPSMAARADAEASFAGFTQGRFFHSLPGNPFVDEIAFAFDPLNPSPFDNSSLATAASFTDRSLHSRSRVDSQEAEVNSNFAESFATNGSHWTVFNPGPGSSFDLDLFFTIEGTLDAAGSAYVDTPIVDHLLGSVDVSIRLYFPSLPNPIDAFTGAATLEVIENPADPNNRTFTVQGDWTESDFIVGDTGFDLSPGFASFGARATTELNGEFHQTVPAEKFGVVIQLETRAEGLGVFEEGYAALSDFFDSASFYLSTTTPGVSISSSEIPEPCTGLLLAIGLVISSNCCREVGSTRRSQFRRSHQLLW